MFGLKLFRIRGQSMAPTFENGDFVLAKVAVSSSKLKENDLIILHRTQEQAMVKRIIGGDAESGFEIQGDNVLSAPKIDLGRVLPDDIKGKVIMIIGKNGTSFV